MHLHREAEKKEQVIAVGLDTGEYDADVSIEELASLVDTAGGEVIHSVLQKRRSPDPATYLGSGRLEEVSLIAKENEADLIVVDAELSAAQILNMEKVAEVPVIDRTMLILDIFAGRAHSSEGKLQVELAQLRYTLPRLLGQGKALSRLAGGIGTRGPGETKLEKDRRHIRSRIYALNEELSEVAERRERYRARRRKQRVRTVAIVGYTNAGKSTLLNYLTNAGVLTEDKLFATLDPTARRLELPNGEEVVMIDTVGLVRRLPHTLVEAFKSTLEEAAAADVILNVCDASASDAAEHLSVTTDLLREIGADDIPVISVMNKCDLVPSLSELPTLGRAVHISARTGKGVDTLLQTIVDTLPKKHCRAEMLLPFTQGALAGKVREEGVIHSEEYKPEGVFFDATVPLHMLDDLKEFITHILG